ncbi:MAG: hypothetical protein HYY22_02065 [Thaumarchaeota archaeon]|nr:hypothetical protein [Nitrososphaerota archaeon]
MGKRELAWLADFLGLDIEDITRESGFKNRLLLQKTVHFLKHTGVEPFKEYKFNRYLHGPYSPDLANDYYNLEGVKFRPVEIDEPLVLWYSNHNEEWLEVASSIISFNRTNPDLTKTQLYDSLRMSKPWVGLRQFLEIRDELDEKGVLSGTHTYRLYHSIP